MGNAGVDWGWALRLTLFGLVSAGLLSVSRASLRRPGSHGFYRFFAWEAILALALLNLKGWFDDPFGWHQLISWLLLLGSISLAIHGFQLLGRLGGSDPRRGDPALLGLEKTSRLVQRGAYRFIRHPLYSSLLLLGWGAFFKDPGPGGLGLALGMTACLALTARVEERENLAFFGEEYAAYMRRTKMFVPYVL